MGDRAHMVLIHDICDDGVCKKLASYRVFTRGSSLHGQYCEEHARRKMDALNEYDAACDAEYAKRRRGR